MTIEKIEAQTKAFAAQRTAVITEAAQMQIELDAVHKRFAPNVRKQVEQLIALQADLTASLEASPELFPAGNQSRVFDGIKVGYQSGKASVAGVDATVTVVKLELLRDEAKKQANRERLERIAGALTYQPKLIDAGLRKLTPEEQAEIGIHIAPGAQSVLIKPAQEEAYKAVESTIKAVMAATQDL